MIFRRTVVSRFGLRFGFSRSSEFIGILLKKNVRVSSLEENGLRIPKSTDFHFAGIDSRRLIKRLENTSGDFVVRAQDRVYPRFLSEKVANRFESVFGVRFSGFFCGFPAVGSERNEDFHATDRL